MNMNIEEPVRTHSAGSETEGDKQEVMRFNLLVHVLTLGLWTPNCCPSTAHRAREL